MVRKKVSKRLPGGKTIVSAISKKPSKAVCGSCGIILHGVIRGTNMKRKNTSKSSKRPERPYGGVLCSKCTRLTFKKRIREEN
tara:strand:+ start:215 stop:463 length:249 start_codon:yes stop_codon:yes gene_type:complete